MKGDALNLKMRGRLHRRKEILLAVVMVFGLLGAVAVLALGAIRFEDDFAPPSLGWLVGPDPQGTALWSFLSGAYQVFLVRPNAISWSLNPTGEEFEWFCADTQALIASLAAGEVGLAFAARDEDGRIRFHTLGIFRDGTYRLGHFSDGELVDLPVTTAPIKLQPADAFNSLRVVAHEDGSVEFYGNGELLATVEPGELDPTGEIGFFARAEEPFVTGQFAFIRIMTPDCEP